jgi:ribulose-bisphosphate carboxylase large chain
MIPSTTLNLSGNRFTVWYRLSGTKDEAQTKADNICLEQTVEFPYALIPDGPIRDHIIGKIESFDSIDEHQHLVKISYAIETTAFELTQTLNVIYGNISLIPGIRVEGLELPGEYLRNFQGPRFGRDGLRQLLNIPKRPLLCTALKPMGLSAKQLGEIAYQLALGGLDIIKDDHGLSNQPFAPFQERVRYCVEGVERANRQTGKQSIYMPNITAPAERVFENALFAKENGAGGLLISPGLTGFDIIRQIAIDPNIKLPIFSHPTFLGSMINSPDNGIAHNVIFGQLTRLAGADATIFPNYGGRFSFSLEECQKIVTGTTIPMGQIKTIFPVPGGGMSLARINDMLQVYGNDVVLLIGGDLHRHGPDLTENCRIFKTTVESLI